MSLSVRQFARSSVIRWNKKPVLSQAKPHDAAVKSNKQLIISSYSKLVFSRYGAEDWKSEEIFASIAAYWLQLLRNYITFSRSSWAYSSTPTSRFPASMATDMAVLPSCHTANATASSVAQFANNFGWLGGVTVRASDLRSGGRGFDSRPGRYQAT